MDSSREQDRSIERVLRQSLKAPHSGGVADACLDAETLAAWLDGGLSGGSLAMVESHLADCVRCQSVVRALARIDSASSVSEPTPAARGWLTWVVPLAAAAAAVAVWVAVPDRKAPRLPQATEFERPAVDTQAQQPPVGADRPRAAARETSVEPELSTSVPNATARGAAARNVAARKQADVGSDLPQAAPPEADRLKEQSLLSKSSPSSAADAQGQAALTAGATPSQPAAGAASSQPSANLFDSVRSTARRAEVAAVEIISPAPMVRWRIAGSSVERSTDGGAGWETQPTGTLAELTAGAAPSPLVCWVVGRRGVVLLSTDGHSWRRVAFPEATDLSAVRARDARTASVSTADGRFFSTTDAGATWAPRPLQDF